MIKLGTCIYRPMIRMEYDKQSLTLDSINDTTFVGLHVVRNEIRLFFVRLVCICVIVPNKSFKHWFNASINHINMFTQDR